MQLQAQSPDTSYLSTINLQSDFNPSTFLTRVHLLNGHHIVQHALTLELVLVDISSKM